MGKRRDKYRGELRHLNMKGPAYSIPCIEKRTDEFRAFFESVFSPMDDNEEGDDYE